MRIFNSFSEKKEILKTSQKINLYVCGITPYDTSHLGHTFTFTIYDVLVRYLRFLGCDVTYVQNVTDIDDDILLKAKSLKTSWKTLGRKETQKFLKNMDSINNLRPDIYPKATDHIKEIIEINIVLIEKGLAYVKNGSVYFEISKDPNFGKLSKLSYREMLKIANEKGNYPEDPNKIDPLDFVLWQKTKRGEPFWESPWGKGRPGWHVECSAMSLKYLGPTITIHGGGEDLIFPHHEAEIAQSENFTGEKFVKIWMHVAMVYCGDKKMSKSLGNMIFVSDLLKKYSSNAIRIYLLSHHWGKSWNCEEKELEKAQEIANLLEKYIKSPIPTSTDVILLPSRFGLSLTVEDLSREKDLIQKEAPDFFKALDDDLDTPKAIKLLVKMARAKKQRPEIIQNLSKILGLVF